MGLLNYIRVDDCQSEEKIELTYCEASRCTFVYEGHNNITKLYTYNLSHLSFSHPQGKCSSKSRYSLEKHKVESECVCCSATGTVPMNVSLRCANGTRTHHQVLAVTGCDCMSHACPTDWERAHKPDKITYTWKTATIHFHICIYNRYCCSVEFVTTDLLIIEHFIHFYFSV